MASLCLNDTLTTLYSETDMCECISFLTAEVEQEVLVTIWLICNVALEVAFFTSDTPSSTSVTAKLMTWIEWRNVNNHARTFIEHNLTVLCIVLHVSKKVFFTLFPIIRLVQTVQDCLMKRVSRLEGRASTVELVLNTHRLFVERLEHIVPLFDIGVIVRLNRCVLLTKDRFCQNLPLVSVEAWNDILNKRNTVNTFNLFK